VTLVANTPLLTQGYHHARAESVLSEGIRRSDPGSQVRSATRAAPSMRHRPARGEALQDKGRCCLLHAPFAAKPAGTTHRSRKPPAHREERRLLDALLQPLADLVEQLVLLPVDVAGGLIVRPPRHFALLFELARCALAIDLLGSVGARRACFLASLSASSTSARSALSESRRSSAQRSSLSISASNQQPSRVVISASSVCRWAANVCVSSAATASGTRHGTPPGRAGRTGDDTVPGQ